MPETEHEGYAFQCTFSYKTVPGLLLCHFSEEFRTFSHHRHGILLCRLRPVPSWLLLIRSRKFPSMVQTTSLPTEIEPPKALTLMCIWQRTLHSKPWFEVHILGCPAVVDHYLYFSVLWSIVILMRCTSSYRLSRWRVKGLCDLSSVLVHLQMVLISLSSSGMFSWVSQFWNIFV